MSGSTNEFWYRLHSGLCHPAFNMALDEALLNLMPRLQRPVLRFYGWTEPAASFGYFQKYADVERATLLRPLVRRPTGGGIVQHDCDWTYSLVFPAGHEWHGLKAVESYRRVHAWLQRAFDLLGIETELAAEARKGEAGQCFVGHERFDVLWRGRKIAGAAQRRRREGLLIQGSVQFPLNGFNREQWEQAMCEAGELSSWQELPLDDPLLAAARKLEFDKYSREAYNRRI
ncbi:MAG TPA: lipoate--protein ligase family protein [Verrucomicrobia bacterium]|nr:lipoate--protein ligase family protein [Verrucomicrobiota bacterium]HOB33419.1 lipoate--protein ligase family protein [Verrucomicrobiota bacterium]HOP96257.1 lipoate--protein ligase family protein [Verrucomicrobiota bacterium]